MKKFICSSRTSDVGVGNLLVIDYDDVDRIETDSEGCRVVHSKDGDEYEVYDIVLVDGDTLTWE